MRKHAKLSASGSEKWMTCTPSAQLEDQFPHFNSRLGIQAVGGFVKDYHAWIVQQCACDTNSLSHPVTETLDELVTHVDDSSSLHDLFNTGDPLTTRDSKCRSEKVEILVDSHVVI